MNEQRIRMMFRRPETRKDPDRSRENNLLLRLLTQLAYTVTTTEGASSIEKGGQNVFR